MEARQTHTYLIIRVCVVVVIYKCLITWVSGSSSKVTIRVLHDDITS